MSLPFVVCLCPTYRRPDLLENAIACFERQDYPADRRLLLAEDDSGELPELTQGDNWSILSHARRYGSLCEKYNAMALQPVDAEECDILMVWEDDDVYLPGHISKHVEAYMRSGSIGKPAWCKPPYAWTTHPHEYTNLPYTEQTAGRFHASISLTRQMFDAVGGWPNTKELNFDQQFMAAMDKIAPPLQTTHPWTYVFRWADTGAYHGQAYGDDWWDRIPHETTPQPRDAIVPRLDASAAMLMDFCKRGR
jgi:hypothetical protein